MSYNSFSKLKINIQSSQTIYMHKTYKDSTPNKQFKIVFIY